MRRLTGPLSAAPPLVNAYKQIVCYLLTTQDDRDTTGDRTYDSIFLDNDDDDIAELSTSLTNWLNAKTSRYCIGDRTSAADVLKYCNKELGIGGSDRDVLYIIHYAGSAQRRERRVLR